MPAIEDSRSWLYQVYLAWTYLPGTDQGQFEVMKSQVLKQIMIQLISHFAYFDMKEVAYKEVELELVSLPFFAGWKKSWY